MTVEGQPIAPPIEGAQTGFVKRVAGVFATRISQFVIALAVSLALALLLGDKGRGQYAVVMLVPGTLYALATFGLPSSTTFYSGRGRSLRSLRTVTLTMVAAASTWLIVLGLVSMPFFEKNLLQTAPDDLLRLILIAIPFQFGASLMGSILYGRQITRNYNLILVAQSAATLIGIFVFVGLLHRGVRGAIESFILVTILAAIAVFWELRRAVHVDDPARPRVEYRELLGYGMKLYPSVITSFFNYRADIYLLSWLLASSQQVGWYAVAVSFAEMTFYVPDSVSSIFFPRVAASRRDEADRAVTDVSRLTILITILIALAIVPAGYVVFHFVLTKFGPSFPALLVLLPGVVSLSLSKVLAGYLTGLGKAVPVGAAATIAVVVNVACNLVLIPRFGIVGASASSLISYTLHASIMLFFSVRASGMPPARFIVPRVADVRRVYSVGMGFARSLVQARRARTAS